MQIPEEIYQTIVQVMPIPCVDLIPGNAAGEVLLVRRTSEPAVGEWWFPGGRVHFQETREAAARRKLLEECGLTASKVEELWTVDSMLPVSSDAGVRHGITTLYSMAVVDSSQVRLDANANDFAWHAPAHWHQEHLHPFVREMLSRATARLSTKP